MLENLKLDAAKVRIAACDKDRQRIYRFRYDAYLRQLGLPSREDNQFYCDPMDAYSTHFMLMRREEIIGCLRGTTMQNGLLEIEQQNENWAEAIAEIAAGDTPRIAEINRLIVERPFRGLKTLRSLFSAAFAEGRRQQVDLVLFAGKVDVLSRLYRVLGGEVVSQKPQPYRLAGRKLGEYLLMKFDLRKSFSSGASAHFNGTERSMV